MKRIFYLILCMMFCLSACGSLEVDGTPALGATPTPIETFAQEPQLSETSFLSYEDYFAQTIDYGSIFDEENCYYDHVEWIAEDDPAIALAQRLVEDTLGLIPITMNSVADHCVYSFWAGNEEGASIYRLYYPTKTLDCIYSITAEELKEKYYYTPKTEVTVYILKLRDIDCQVGERVCLIRGIAPRTNQLFEWGTVNPEFLALFDEMASHKEEYPQYKWGEVPYDEIVPWIEANHAGEQLYLRIYRCVNAATGEYREKTSATYGEDQYEVQW